jgi:UDP-N-acetylglucosamine 4,6-dehydratase
MKINQLIKFFSNKSVFITGGTGSLGNELIKIFLTDFKLRKLIIFSRDELKQSEMIRAYSKNDKRGILRFFLGDVRDLERLKFAMRNVDFVIHAAALKHVDLAEYNPMEYVNTNIAGGKNVIEASFYNKVSKIVALSTDKAANPINLYGATKLVSDKLFVSSNNISGNEKTKFSVVRYGNVVSSRGSVIPFFLDLEKKNANFFPITDIKMTRFWITLRESAYLVINSFYRMYGGEIYVPKIPSIKIVDVAKAIAPNKKIKIVGIRPGEKLSEILCSKDEYFNTIEFKNYYVVKPSIRFSDKDVNYLKSKEGEKGKIVAKNFEYSSSNNKKFLSVNDLKKFIKNELKK